MAARTVFGQAFGLLKYPTAEMGNGIWDMGTKESLSQGPFPISHFPFPPFAVQSTNGSMIAANAVRARFRRDFTVPRLHEVISAISS